MNKHRLILSILLILTLFNFLSCDDIIDCLEQKGTLELTNDSYNTFQSVIINGVNYGTLDPDETEEFQLTPGTYQVQQVGISGGGGCSSFIVNIVECDIQSFSCSN